MIKIKNWIKSNMGESNGGSNKQRSNHYDEEKTNDKDIPSGHDDSSISNKTDGENVEGERGIPSVNKSVNIRTRINNILAFGLFVLLGGGFLAWYYTSMYFKTEEARESAALAELQRISGEMRLPPLGRIEPPSQKNENLETSVADVLYGTEPPPLTPIYPPNYQNYSGAPSSNDPSGKTPEELALELKLNSPVILRNETNNLGIDNNQNRNTQNTGNSLAGGETPLNQMLVPTITESISAQILPDRRFLLSKGTFIDCTLETAVDSTYDGFITCIGANDVYSDDGKVVLLERGTKYVGEKRGEIRQGAGRVFVLWNEARTDTGVVANLNSPGTDELGRAGLPGFVDNHFWQRFGAALMISVVNGAVLGAVASQQDGGGTSVFINPQASNQVISSILGNTMNIPPTVVINQGERIQILVSRDVNFESVYSLIATKN